MPASSFSGPGYGSSVTQGKNKQIVWDAAADGTGPYRVASAFVLWRARSRPEWFLFPQVHSPWDAFNDANSSELPLHKVYVSAFYIDRYDVTKSMWDGIFEWAIQHGYSFDNAGFRKLASNMEERLGDRLRVATGAGDWNGVDPALAFTAIYLQFFTYFLVEKLFGGRRHLGVPDPVRSSSA